MDRKQVLSEEEMLKRYVEVFEKFKGDTSCVFSFN